MSYVGNVTIGSSTSLVGSTLYGTCDTAAGTAAKVVTCANFDKLLTGVTIHVKFTNSNSVANPTLNVNSTGAKTIYRYGTTAPSTTSKTSWNAGSVVSFTYDGTNWIMNDWLNDDTDTNTTYTFANGTNGFTVTPSGGSAQTVTVTPSISNNVTGSGTNGYIAKWNGANTVTNGPAFGSATTTYLRNDGSWATPTNTTYTGANGVSLSGTTFSNSGVRSIATGTSNGTINVNTNGSTANVAVKGLGSAAYTASTDYATSGHNHDSTYLKLAGGTMTGQITLASNGYRTSNNAGYSIDQYGNFKALNAATASTANFGLVDNGGTTRIKMYWTSGNIETTGSVTATNGFVGDLTGVASTASHAKVELTNPTSQSTYYPVWVNGSGDGKLLRANDGLRLLTLEGTAETEGTAIFGVGNPTATGTAGNKKGTLRIYSSSGKQSNIVSESNGAHRTIHLPDKSGTVAMTSDITDTKVKVTNTNPTALTSYYPIWVDSSGTKEAGANNGLKYNTLEGTTTGTGIGLLTLGNSISTGSDGNKKGQLRIYSTGSKYGEIFTGTLTDNREYTLPDRTGTIALTDDFKSTTTGTTLTFPGVPKDCLGRFRMFTNGYFTDHYFVVSNSGTVPYLTPVTGSAYVSDIQYNNTTGAVIVTIPSSMSGGFYRLEVVSQLKG